jgi:hypothetical protein
MEYYKQLISREPEPPFIRVNFKFLNRIFSFFTAYKPYFAPSSQSTSAFALREGKVMEIFPFFAIRGKWRAWTMPNAFAQFKP